MGFEELLRECKDFLKPFKERFIEPTMLVFSSILAILLCNFFVHFWESSLMLAQFGGLDCRL